MQTKLNNESRVLHGQDVRAEMEKDGGRSKMIILKSALIILAVAISTFFVVQASLGAHPEGAVTIANITGDGSEQLLGASIYASLSGLLDELTRVRAYQLTPSWELATSGKVFISEKGGNLYITSTRGRVMAVNAESGSILWNLDLGVWVSAPPAVDAGVVYVGATNHVLYAFDAGSGALLWYYTSQGEILARPVISGGIVFFTADNDSIYDLVHRLYALDSSNGTPLWFYDTESWTPSPPAVGKDAVYLGGYRREVYALEKTTGRELWSFKAPNIVTSSPQITASSVFFSCIDGWVYSLDAASGDPLWSRKLPGFVWLAPLDVSGNLYACSHLNTLTSMAPDTGEERWNFDDGDFLSCSPLPGIEAVCAFNATGKGYVLNTSGGELMGTLLTPHDFASAPLLKGGFIYSSSSDGFVRAYALPAGWLN